MSAPTLGRCAQQAQQLSLFEATPETSPCAPPDDFWRLMAPPDEDAAALWSCLSLDEKLDFAASDPKSWSDLEQRAFALRVLDMLWTDTHESLAAYRQRRECNGGELRFASTREGEEDRMNFIALLGWICGCWQGVTPFATLAAAFGARHDVIREAAEAEWADYLHLVHEVMPEHFRLH